MNDQPHQWTITGVSETMLYDPVHGPQPAKRVEFKTHHGYVGAIDIPDSAFTDEHVAKRVQEAHDRVHAVMGMHGPNINAQG